MTVIEAICVEFFRVSFTEVKYSNSFHIPWLLKIKKNSGGKCGRPQHLLELREEVSKANNGFCLLRSVPRIHLHNSPHLCCLLHRQWKLRHISLVLGHEHVASFRSKSRRRLVFDMHRSIADGHLLCHVHDLVHVVLCQLLLLLECAERPFQCANRLCYEENSKYTNGTGKYRSNWTRDPHRSVQYYQISNENLRVSLRIYFIFQVACKLLQMWNRLIGFFICWRKSAPFRYSSSFRQTSFFSQSRCMT